MGNFASKKSNISKNPKIFFSNATNEKLIIQLLYMGATPRGQSVELEESETTMKGGFLENNNKTDSKEYLIMDFNDKNTSLSIIFTLAPHIYGIIQEVRKVVANLDYNVLSKKLAWGLFINYVSILMYLLGQLNANQC